MDARASVSIVPEQMPEHCPSNATQRNVRNATNATGPRLHETPCVPDAPNPVDKSIWVQSELNRIAAEAAELTPEHVERLCRKFRTEIGGVYAHIADYLEAVAS